MTAYEGVLLLSCTKEETYSSRLALVVKNVSELADTAPATHSLEFVAIPRFLTFSVTSPILSTAGSKLS